MGMTLSWKVGFLSLFCISGGRAGFCCWAMSSTFLFGWLDLFRSGSHDVLLLFRPSSVFFRSGSHRVLFIIQTVFGFFEPGSGSFDEGFLAERHKT